MTTVETVHRAPTPHERRVDLVAAAIRDHSTLTGDAARALAEAVLAAIDHVPEKMR
ncbi:DUF6307 family protein [Pseudonocardia xishanensis]|uniref:Uncharacterized protein n=1 Tax=Pseudonocardia xishanensis TaxID=630995 RepID=A0ABP8RUG3_9PSEU